MPKFIQTMILLKLAYYVFFQFENIIVLVLLYFAQQKHTSLPHLFYYINIIIFYKRNVCLIRY